MDAVWVLWIIAGIIYGGFFVWVGRQNWKLRKRRKLLEEAKKLKTICRIEVADQYVETDNVHEMASLLSQLIGGFNSHFKTPVKPEDIRISVRSAPADPELPKWKTIS